jgi:hypothetical protein
MNLESIFTHLVALAAGLGGMWFYFYWTGGGAKGDLLDLKEAIREALEEAEAEVDELGDKFDVAADKLLKKIFG